MFLIESFIIVASHSIATTEIEQGTDLLSPSADINETKIITINQQQQTTNGSVYKSHSVGSCTMEDEECLDSDPVLGNAELPGSLEDGQEYLRKWLDSGPTVCSEENLYPEEVLGTTSSVPLTARTDALLNTKSFNLVKPKYQ